MSKTWQSPAKINLFLHMMTQNCMLDADVSPKKTIQQTFNIFK
jgi:hypothetical protein